MFINFYNLSSYLPILIFIVFAIFVSIALIALPLIFNLRTLDSSKLDIYECGVKPTGSSRSIFNARFYLVAMLFIIFDLEIVFLFPWAVALGGLHDFGFWIAMVFLFILALGFIYEWKKGALEWE